MKLTEAQKARIEDIRSKELVILDGQYGAYVKLGSIICRELVPNEEGFDVIVKALYTKQEFKKTICEDLDSWLDKFQTLKFLLNGNNQAKEKPVVVSEFTPVHKDMSVKTEDLHLVKKDELDTPKSFTEEVRSHNRVAVKKNPNKLTQLLNSAKEEESISPLIPAIQENADRVYDSIKKSRYGVLIYSAIYKEANTTHDNLQFYLDELVRTERLFKHPKLGIYAVDKKYLDNAAEIDVGMNEEAEDAPNIPSKADNYHRTSPIHKFTKEQTLEMNEKRKTMLAADIAKEYGISKNQLSQWIFKAERDNWIEHVDMRKVTKNNPKVNRAKINKIYEEAQTHNAAQPKTMEEPIVYQPPTPKPERNKTLEPCMGLSMNTRLAMAAELTKELEQLDKQLDGIIERQCEIQEDLIILNV